MPSLDIYHRMCNTIFLKTVCAKSKNVRDFDGKDSRRTNGTIPIRVTPTRTIWKINFLS